MNLSNRLYLIRHSLFIGAPPGVHPVRASVVDGLNSADIALLNPEQFGDMPGPVQHVMVEEAERERYSAFPVHGYESTVADS